MRVCEHGCEWCLRFERSGLEPWLGTLCGVLGKTRSASFHPLVYKWIPENLMPREPRHLRFACILEKCFTKDLFVGSLSVFK